MKVQEKPVRTPLMILGMLSSSRDTSAFEDACKTVSETFAKRGQNILHLQVSISEGKL